MATDKLPTLMRSWQFSTTKGGIEKNLKLNTSAPLPKPKADQHLIKVIAAALNPVDYKSSENPIANMLLVPKNATPALDVAGRVVQPARGSGLEPGQLVVGVASEVVFAGGALSEYIAVPTKLVTPVPAGVSALDAAALPVASLTAWQSITPYIKSGSRIFMNGGSGGTGVFGIQIAKSAGAHVTVSCSTRNVELCKSLGADEVLDYTKGSLLKQLQETSRKNGLFDFVVDNVFSDVNLYWNAHTYTNSGAKYVNIAGAPTVAYIIASLKIKLTPAFLGGGKRKFITMLCESKVDQLNTIASLVAEKKLRVVLDQVYPMEEAVEAYRKLKSGRARGKIVVEVAKDEV